MSGMVGIGRAGGLAAATCALLLCMVASLAIGAVRIPPGDVFAALTSSNGSDAHLVVTELRVPRTALGVLVGAALGVAGALMQGVTRNPLAEPGILGVNAGAAVSWPAFWLHTYGDFATELDELTVAVKAADPNVGD